MVDVLEPGEFGGLGGLYGMLGMERDPNAIKRLAVIRWGDIPADTKVAATPAKEMREILGTTFRILTCESSEALYGRSGDAWVMRREFLKLKRDSWGLLQFLQRWGVWDEKRLGSVGLAPGSNANIENVVFEEQIWQLQSAYRAALIGPPDEWLGHGIDPLKGAFASSLYPHFILEHHRCKPAIEATITIDLLRKVKFRKCKRADCSEVFKLESKHKRVYCSQPCAHLESVRKQRRVAARQKKKSNSRKGA